MSDSLKKQPAWQRNEFVHPGVDFSDAQEADVFQRAVPRDQAEWDQIIATLGLGKEHTLIDLGAGAGGFALHAARLCRRVYAVDVAEAMLMVGRRAAEAEGVTNIEFVSAGFLTYEHEAAPVDAVVSHVALHHLPDAWKQIALTRIARMLKEGGRLQLKDVVHRFDPADYVSVFDAFVAAHVELFGQDIAAQAEATLRDEFPTWDWIMEGILRRAGFTIDAADYRGALAEYYCTK